VVSRGLRPGAEAALPPARRLPAQRGGVAVLRRVPGARRIRRASVVRDRRHGDGAVELSLTGGRQSRRGRYPPGPGGARAGESPVSRRDAAATLDLPVG